MKKSLMRVLLAAVLVIAFSMPAAAADWFDSYFWNGLFKGSVTVQGQVKQFKRDVTVSAMSKSVEEKDSGQIFSNYGATGQVTFDLPAAVEGLTYTFVVSTEQSLKIKPASSASRIMGLTDANGNSITSSTVGNTITITATQPSEWFVEKYYGTGWSDTN
jgi:opacity protein-like surface antigen